MPKRLLATLRLFLALGLILGLGACASLFGNDPLKIDLVGLEPLAGQGMEARFAVKLRVQNPNDRDIDYDGVALDLSINGRPLASGVSDQRGQVPRFGEAVLSVPVSISAFRLVRQAWGLGNAPPRQGMPYEISGKLGGGLFGTARFSDKGTLEWPAGAPLPTL
ncbi:MULTISPECIES: LEA type 2 family protein [Pseudomonas]|jgi:hypothetical protein|uniref:LEA type 2 family protein n=1 Tax=Pseudomonas TaxID=286 RepID=UPI0002A2A471|nr:MULTISPECIES: LEA type 2 family protein [unclassified Pseudomonas]MBB1606917.1 water stress/hypersensitive response domain-containing protein [Pseudomonas sp. UMC76]MBB1638265.1 water stress/hypersensitive response domain-containing protein [Pseudomonas sp. UME83]NTX88090.1 water stress/hypersensitive response domain-containing protein [Pseudomonas sp. UMA643]NTY16884.1 water stress/hypersensitive response domain-containing protein [Pseudomonas sp. UMC3103]NTY23013.1 water stress/hypersensi